MRGSSIFAGLVIIALAAIGLIYLEDHGYFSNPHVAPLGMMRSDDNAPRPEPASDQAQGNDQGNAQYPSATATTSVNPNTGESENIVSPPGLPPAVLVKPLHETGNAAMNNPQPAPAQTINQPGAPANPTVNNGQTYTTAAGAPVHVAYPAASQVAANPPAQPTASRTRYVDANGNPCRPVQVQVPVSTVHHVHHYIHHVHENWSWAPRVSRASTPCGMIRQTATGQRVVNLVSGMMVNIALDQDVSTTFSTPGEGFSGYLVGPITYCGEVIVPAGAAVQGIVESTHRHARWQADDAVLQLRLTAMDANGYRVPLAANSYNRRTTDEIGYKNVYYMNDPNFVDTTRTTNHDVTLPANSVVSFWLQTPAAVYF